MPKNTIREKFEKEFWPDFREGDIDTDRITDFFMAEFDSLLAEKVGQVEKLRQKGLEHKGNYNMGLDAALQILKQDK